MNKSKGRVGFVGAGQMGLPMVRRLADDGWEVVTFARRAETRSECAAAGASATSDLLEAVRDVQAVVVCLFVDAQIRELAFGSRGFLESMAPGALLVVHTTGSPATTRELAELGAERGIRVVDAPVSGTAQDIEQGYITVLLGGDDGNVEEAAELVAAYGDPILRIGPLGGAMVVKLLNNALFAAHLQLAGEVERVAGVYGIPMSAVASAIMQSSGSSHAMGVVSKFGSLAAVAAAAGPFLAEDLAVVEDVVGELGLDLGALGYVNDSGPITFEPRQSCSD